LKGGETFDTLRYIGFILAFASSIHNKLKYFFFIRDPHS
jgi:hypothetical protein